MRNIYNMFIFFAFSISLVIAVHAAVPQLMNYQGKLLTASGAAYADGTYSMVFALYAVPTGGTALWSETNTKVQTKSGLFSVLLGSINNFGANLFATPQLFLGVTVGKDAEMTPRQQIVSSAFAFKAAIADTVPDGAITTAKIANGAVTGAQIAPQSINMANMGTDWADYLPSFGGFATAPSNFICKWCQIGKVVFFTYQGGMTTGLSNSKSFTISLPVAPSKKFAEGNYPIFVYDNSAWVAGGGFIQLLPGNTTANIGKLYNNYYLLNICTATGNKDAIFSIFYPVD